MNISALVTIPREDYDALVSDRARLDTVRELVSKTSFVSRSELLLILGTEDKLIRGCVKESENDD